jgi:hypothetical protein
VFGSGMPGCLFDYGPERAHTTGEAIDSLVQLFGDLLEEGEEDELRAALADGGTYYFRDPHEAGAVYCEVSRDDDAPALCHECELAGCDDTGESECCVERLTDEEWEALEAE